MTAEQLASSREFVSGTLNGRPASGNDPEIQGLTYLGGLFSQINGFGAALNTGSDTEAAIFHAKSATAFAAYLAAVDALADLNSYLWSI